MIQRMNVGPTATKKSVLEQLLDQGMVLVALDARVDGVEVPDHLGRDAQLRLNLSYRFGLPMTVDAWGILATLTFAGVPFNCRFPWRSVFLMVSHVSGQPYLFPDDIPPELLSQAKAEAGVDAKIFTSVGAQAVSPARPKLELVRHVKSASGQTPQKLDVSAHIKRDGPTDAAGEASEARANKAAPGKLSALQALRLAKGKKPRAETDGAADDAAYRPVSGDKADRTSSGLRVAPALRRRNARGNRPGAEVHETKISDPEAHKTHRKTPADAAQTVSQPSRVRLSASDKPDAAAHPSAKSTARSEDIEDTSGSKNTEPDDPSRGAGRRKGSHLRVIK